MAACHGKRLIAELAPENMELLVLDYAASEGKTVRDKSLKCC